MRLDIWEQQLHCCDTLCPVFLEVTLSSTDLVCWTQSVAFNLLPCCHCKLLHGINWLLIVYGFFFSLLLSLSVTVVPYMLLCRYLALWRFKPNSLPFVRLAALKRWDLPAEEKLPTASSHPSDCVPLSLSLFSLQLSLYLCINAAGLSLQSDCQPWMLGECFCQNISIQSSRTFECIVWIIKAKYWYFNIEVDHWYCLLYCLPPAPS